MPDAMYFSDNNRAASIYFVFYSTAVSSMTRVWCLEIVLFLCNNKKEQHPYFGIIPIRSIHIILAIQQYTVLYNIAARIYENY